MNPADVESPPTVSTIFAVGESSGDGERLVSGDVLGGVAVNGAG